MEYGFVWLVGAGEAQDVVVYREMETKCGSGEKGGIWGGDFVEKRVKKRRKTGVFFFEKTEKNLAI